MGKVQSVDKLCRDLETGRDGGDFGTQTVRQFWLSEWVFTFSYLALFHISTHHQKNLLGVDAVLLCFFFLMTSRYRAASVLTDSREASTQLNLSVAPHHRHLHAVNSLHIANSHLLLKTLSSAPSKSLHSLSFTHADDETLSDLQGHCGLNPTRQMGPT